MYQIRLKSKAEKQLGKLSAADRQRVLDELDAIAVNPFAAKKLHGEWEGYYSRRVWPYRVIYSIDRSVITVTIVNIGHRQGVYKK